METTTKTNPVPNEERHYPFTEETQKKIVAMMVYDPSIWPKAKEFIKPEYFENPVLADTAIIIHKFYDTYHRPPTWEEVVQELDIFLTSSRQPKPNEVYVEQVCDLLADGAGADFSYVHDRLVEFAQYQAAKNAILKSVDLLRDKQDYAGILKEIREAAAVGTGTSGLDIDMSRNGFSSARYRVKGRGLYPAD